MSKFKKGDKVKVVAKGRCNHNFPIGSTAEVLGEMMFGIFNCVGESDSGYELFQTVEASDIEHIKEEVKPKMKFKAGDKVRVINNDSHHHFFEIGQVVEVESIYKDGAYNCIQKMDTNIYSQILYDENIELVEDEKIVGNIDSKVVHLKPNSLAQFIRIGDVVIAVPKEVPIGIATCHDDDEFCEDSGRGIAFERLIENSSHLF